MIFDSEKFTLACEERKKLASKQLLIDFWDLETRLDFDDKPAVIAILLTGLNSFEKVSEREEAECHSLTDRVLKDIAIPDAIHAKIKLALALFPRDGEPSPLALHAARVALKLLLRSNGTGKPVDSRIPVLSDFDGAAEDLADIFRFVNDRRSEATTFTIPGLSAKTVFKHSCAVLFAKGDLHLAFAAANSNKELAGSAMAEWFEALLEKDYRRLVHHRSAAACLDQKLHLWLLTVLYPAAGTSRRSVTSPTHLKRTCNLQNESRRTLHLLKVTIFLDEIRTAENASTASQFMTLEFQKILDLIVQHDSLLVTLAAAKNIADKCGNPVVSEFLQSQYQLTCDRISGEKSDDLLLKDRTVATFETAPSNQQPQNVVTDRTLRFLKVSRSTIKLFGYITVAKIQKLVSRNENQKNAVKTMSATAIQQFFSEISQLRGALQKFIQIGFPIHNDLPYILRDELATGIATGSLMNTAKVMYEMRKTYGDPAEIFTDFNTTPFACGSIGQVHRAVAKDGREVCLKIRYPGVEDSVKSDFRNIRTITPILQALFPIQPLKQIFIDWERSILSECDFELEKTNHRAVSRVLANTDVKTPLLFDDLSRGPVIVTEYIGGLDFFEFIAVSNQAERNHIGILLWRSVYQLLKNGLFRGDIHPNNYKIEDDKLIMLDLGVVEQGERIKSLSDHFKFMSAIARTDSPAIAALLVKNCWTGSEHTESSANIICKVFGKPFLGEFEFNESYTQEIYRTITSILSRNLIMPRGDEMNFRIFGSLYSMLSLLKAKADWRAELADFLSEEPPQYKLTN